MEQLNLTQITAAVEAAYKAHQHIVKAGIKGEVRTDSWNLYMVLYNLRKEERSKRKEGR